VCFRVLRCFRRWLPPLGGAPQKFCAVATGARPRQCSRPRTPRRMCKPCWLPAQYAVLVQAPPARRARWHSLRSTSKTIMAASGYYVAVPCQIIQLGHTLREFQTELGTERRSLLLKEAQVLHMGTSHVIITSVFNLCILSKKLKHD